MNEWMNSISHRLLSISIPISHQQVDLATLRQLVFERGACQYPRLKQRVIYAGDVPYWDPVEFRIENHVFAAGVDHIDEAGLREYIHQIWGKPLPEHLPMWQFQLIENYDGGNSAVLFRIHHCYADGLSLVGFLLDLVDNNPFAKQEKDSSESKRSKILYNPPVSPTANSRYANQAPVTSDGKKHEVGFKRPPMLKLIANQLVFPVRMIQRAFSSPDHNALHKPGKVLHGTRRVTWTERIDLDRIKAIKNMAQVSLNDVLLSCVSGAFRRYFEFAKQPLIEDIRTNVPISMRPSHDEKVLDNKFTIVQVQLPVGEPDIKKRLQQTKATMDVLKVSDEPLGNYLSQLVLTKLPGTLTKFILTSLANKTTATCSNVPGPSSPLYIGGRKMHDLMFWVPSLSSVGVGCSLISYNGGFRLGVCVDTSLCNDPQQLSKGFVEELDELYRIYVQ